MAQNSPRPSKHVTRMHSAVSNLSYYVTMQSLSAEHGVSGLESMEQESLTGAILLISPQYASYFGHLM